ncbi:MAG: hypothetical protein U0521_00695 [Anaerolineae bacterium]
MSHSRSPQRIVLILPCCIGDVVLATAALQALRRAYPDAHIVWAVGSWSKPAVEHHPLLDGVIDTGAEALPVRTLGGLLRFVRQLRAGKPDYAVSLVRSPLMSLAVCCRASRSAPGSTAPGALRLHRPREDRPEHAAPRSRDLPRRDPRARHRHGGLLCQRPGLGSGSGVGRGEAARGGR